jgi:hypothetical protein
MYIMSIDQRSAGARYTTRVLTLRGLSRSTMMPPLMPF